MILDESEDTVKLRFRNSKQSVEVRVILPMVLIDLGTTIPTPAHAVLERPLQVSRTLDSDVCSSEKVEIAGGRGVVFKKGGKEDSASQSSSKDMRLLILGIFENGQGGIAVDCKLFSAKGYF